MRYSFTRDNIDKAAEEFSSNQNFKLNLLPRLKLLYTVKKQFIHLSNLDWFFEYDHVNISGNRVIIEFKNDVSPDFSFYFEVPLSLNFELRVFLSKSSVHFIDIYNFLLDREAIWENQFPLKAEYHTIPHLIINKATKRYNLGIVNKHLNSEELNESFIDEKILEDFQSGFNLFNPIFDKILEEFKI